MNTHEFGMDAYVQIRPDVVVEDDLRRMFLRERAVGQIVGMSHVAEPHPSIRYLVRFSPSLIDIGFSADELMPAHRTPDQSWTPQVDDVVQVAADLEPRINGVITGFSTDTGECDLRFENGSTDCYPATALLFVERPSTTTVTVDAQRWHAIVEALRETTDYIDDGEVLINDLHYHEIYRRIRDNRHLLKGI